MVLYYISSDQTFDRDGMAIGTSIYPVADLGQFSPFQIVMKCVVGREYHNND